MTQPLVSIITPVHNSAEFLHRAVESVLAQTLPDWELMLVNDASIDESATVVDRFAERDSRIRALHLSENVGAAAARNEGIRRSNGRFVAFLDSDDTWVPEKLSAQIEVANRQGAALIYGPHYIQHHERRAARLIKTAPTVTYRQLLNSTMIATSMAMYDVEKLGKRYMPPEFEQHDLALWLNILREIEYAYATDLPLGTIHKREDSLSSSKLVSARRTWRLYRDQEQLPLPRAVWHFGNYALRAVLKYIP